MLYEVITRELEPLDRLQARLQEAKGLLELVHDEFDAEVVVSITQDLEALEKLV